jgi:hypothetical protein
MKVNANNISIGIIQLTAFGPVEILPPFGTLSKKEMSTVDPFFAKDNVQVTVPVLQIVVVHCPKTSQIP